MNNYRHQVAATTLVGIGVLLSVCTAEQNTIPAPSQYETERKVPVLEYKVQSGDGLIHILKKEISRDTTPFRHRDIGKTVSMEGDGADVHYSFGFFPIIAELNDQLPRKNRHGFINEYADFELQKGETVRFPDFNKDGKINGKAGRTVGSLLLFGSRTGTKPIRKQVSYRPAHP